jgi:hypothetical protein
MSKVHHYILAATILIASCGTTENTLCEAGGCYLVGSWTEEEAQALTVVTNAIVDAGFTEPGYMINFVHDPNSHFRGTTWREWRNGQDEPRDPSVGYGGTVIHEWCMVLINRCGSKEPYLYSLLIHELVHALGYYEHDRAFKAAEAKIWEYLD